jgi:hypothetical protein
MESKGPLKPKVICEDITMEEQLILAGGPMIRTDFVRLDGTFFKRLLAQRRGLQKPVNSLFSIIEHHRPS